MKKHLGKISAILIVILASTYLLTNCRDKVGAFSARKQKGDTYSTNHNNENKNEANNDQVDPLRSQLVTNLPGAQSIEIMMKTLAAFMDDRRSMLELAAHLKAHGQQPTIFDETNQDTGGLYIVRTETPYNGTRYFHAQYLSDESGAYNPQHMSFEFAPGPNAFSDAISVAEKSFANLPKPDLQDDSYIKWTLQNEKILWIKVLTQDDLEDDPFNAYEASDVGTVRIAIEKNIHADHDHDEHDTSEVETN